MKIMEILNYCFSGDNFLMFWLKIKFFKWELIKMFLKSNESFVFDIRGLYIRVLLFIGLVLDCFLVF